MKGVSTFIFKSIYIMKFIFPQNYNFKSKLLGFLDYYTAIFNIIFFIFIFCLSNLLFKSFEFKLSFIIILYLPILIFSFVGFNGENILYVFFYLYKFLKNRKIYLFFK